MNPHCTESRQSPQEHVQCRNCNLLPSSLVHKVLPHLQYRVSSYNTFHGKAYCQSLHTVSLENLGPPKDMDLCYRSDTVSFPQGNIFHLLKVLDCHSVLGMRRRLPRRSCCTLPTVTRHPSPHLRSAAKCRKEHNLPDNTTPSQYSQFDRVFLQLQEYCW